MFRSKRGIVWGKKQKKGKRGVGEGKSFLLASEGESWENKKRREREKILKKVKTELGGTLSGTVSRQIPYLFSSSLYFSGFLVDSNHCLICLEWI